MTFRQHCYLGAATILFVLLSSVHAQQHANAPDNAGHVLDPHRLDAAIDAAADYIVRVQLNDGRFTYLVHTDPDVEVTPGYNILRHCGTVYALGMANDRAPRQDTAQAIRHAQQYVVDNCLRPVPDRDDLLTVWSDPNITGEPISLAKLGGSGLGLLALLALGPDDSAASIEQLRKLGRFILFMQEPNGRFVARYVPTADGPDQTGYSLYYPGEAALGMLALYEVDPDPQWLQCAADALAYLARSRKDTQSYPADHWALLATAKLLPKLDECTNPVSQDLIIEHAAGICDDIIARKIELQKFTPVRGCFNAEGIVTPTATRLEGLLAVMQFPSDQAQSLRNRLAWHIHDSMQFLLAAQVTEGEHVGGFTRAIAPLPDDHPLVSESFNRKAGEIRIDYVQHALSAMIQYEAWVESSSDE